MIPHVVRGSRMAGLLAYLVGPGRHNEHTNPHLVTGDIGVIAWFADVTLDGSSAMRVAEHLDRPRVVHAQEVKAGHVWHCSLSVDGAKEGPFTDEKWAEIARDFMAGMGFVDAPSAGVRWAAVHHGLSSKGNDHVHLVVQLVREDGAILDIRNDYRRAQSTARELERRHGLVSLQSAVQGRSTVATKRGEIESEQRRQQRHRSDAPSATPPPSPRAPSAPLDPVRRRLERHVRAASASSTTEAEFVRSLRRHGLLLRPFYAKGGTSTVAGYAVAFRPPAREDQPVFYGGGRLARDLTLPSLRAAAGWQTSAGEDAEALQEWRRRAGTGERDKSAASPDQWRACEKELDALRAHLATVADGDTHGWADAARAGAGTLAAWSLRVEGENGGDLSRASQALARSAQLRPTRTPLSRPALHVAATLAGSTLFTGTGRQRSLDAILLREMSRLMHALARMHEATLDARQAHDLRRASDALAAITPGHHAPARAATLSFTGPVRPGATTSHRPTTTPAPAQPVEITPEQER